MAWARVDDKFHSHPRLVAAGIEATGVFARSISYCADYLTDGYVPRAWAEMQGGKKPVQKLIHAGLFIEVEDGLVIKDYLEWNPTREKVLADRERERGKKSKQRGSVSPGESPGDNHGESPQNGAANPGGIRAVS